LSGNGKLDFQLYAIEAQLTKVFSSFTLSHNLLLSTTLYRHISP